MGRKAGVDGWENLTPTGIRSPDRPARSESLYRLSYRVTNTLILLVSEVTIVYKPITVTTARVVERHGLSYGGGNIPGYSWRF